ncbi:MAG: carboxypeptidase-like regulatory domain-containing protein, partial [Bryobacteraceae bacterium]
MRTNPLKFWGLAALFVVGLFCVSAVGQSVTGAISGIVTDTQGGALVGADVTATNTQTGIAIITKTNNSGVYTIPYLKLGTYNVDIKAPGMKEAVITGVLVDQNNISRVDRSLELGSVNEAITVQASA